MRYTVRISRSALAEIGATLEYLREVNPPYERPWLEGLYAAFATLRTLPHRGREAPESPLDGHTVRQILYGKYRIAYVVFESGEVLITHIQHSSLGPSRRG